MTTKEQEQAAFDKIYLGLRAQNFERSSNGKACVYRDQWGRKCAVGQLITDEEYSSIPSIETKSVLYLTSCGLKSLSGVGTLFLLDIQGCHDDGGSDLDRALMRFARERGLTVPK